MHGSLLSANLTLASGHDEKSVRRREPNPPLLSYFPRFPNLLHFCRRCSELFFVFFCYINIAVDKEEEDFTIILFLNQSIHLLEQINCRDSRGKENDVE